MPDINISIKYSKESLAIIKELNSNCKFTHKNWGDEKLLNIRKEIRDHYRNIQEGICVYCRQPVSLQSASNAHVEHIAPKSLYSKFIFEPKNLCVVCADCNEIKREKEVTDCCENTISTTPKNYPRSSNAFIIYHPHFDEWDKHILIFSGFYVDITSKGASTISICKLNRKLHKFGLDDRFVSNPKLFHVAQRLIECGNIEKIMNLFNSTEGDV
ncbi:HNH endonuclease [Morganella morganii]|uniref:HNH endonuclease n=1 Tax=Morganella morganii TaxID=582 RepID=UPI002860FEB2|nr:HNH endonuclease [Morganella morganii]MDR5686137.1 HNH endonuclease domain-containing protein [Morganella morganii]